MGKKANCWSVAQGRIKEDENFEVIFFPLFLPRAVTLSCTYYWTLLFGKNRLKIDNILEHMLIGIATIGTELSHQQRTTQLHPKRVLVTISYVNSRMRKAANYYPCSWRNRRPALFMAVADIFKDQSARKTLSYLWWISHLPNPRGNGSPLCG